MYEASESPDEVPKLIGRVRYRLPTKFELVQKGSLDIKNNERQVTGQVLIYTVLNEKKPVPNKK